MNCFDEFVDEMIAHAREVDRALERFVRSVADPSDPAVSAELEAVADRLKALAAGMPEVPDGLTRRLRDANIEVQEWYGAAVSRLAEAAMAANAEFQASGRMESAAAESKIEGATVILAEVNHQLTEMREGAR